MCIPLWPQCTPQKCALPQSANYHNLIKWPQSPDLNPIPALLVKDTLHGCAANPSAATVWCYHVMKNWGISNPVLEKQFILLLLLTLLFCVVCRIGWFNSISENKQEKNGCCFFVLLPTIQNIRINTKRWINCYSVGWKFGTFLTQQNLCKQYAMWTKGTAKVSIRCDKVDGAVI